MKNKHTIRTIKICIISLAFSLLLMACGNNSRGSGIDIKNKTAVMQFLQGKYTLGDNYINEMHYKIEIVGKKIRVWSHLKGTAWHNEPDCETEFDLSDVTKDSYDSQDSRYFVFNRFDDKCLPLINLIENKGFRVWFYNGDLAFQDWQDGWFEY